jgi:septal ring factor EnvC (AmiA/AmiB activator)
MALIVLASTASTIPTPIATRIQRRFGALESSSRSTATVGRGLFAARGCSTTTSAAGTILLRDSLAGVGGVLRGTSKNVIGSGATGDAIDAGGS